MTGPTRRALGLGAALMTAMLAFGVQADPVGTLKVGYQKTGVPVIARQQHLIEEALKPQGIDVEWVEFTAGPPLVEALNVGAIHVGWTGDAPPIFGQAAGSDILYVAALPPNGKGEGIVVKSGSGIKSVADLKGRKVAFGKGTSANNMVAVALEKAGLAYTDIEPVYLSPADGAAAFAADKVDAWAVWDPFLAIAEVRETPTVLVRTGEVLDVNTFFLANGTFASENGAVIVTTLGALSRAAAWADANRDKVAEALHEVTGVPLVAQQLAADRATFGVFPLDERIIASQQATADRFFRLGLIPKAINVADAVWTAPKS